MRAFIHIAIFIALVAISVVYLSTLPNQATVLFIVATILAFCVIFYLSVAFEDPLKSSFATFHKHVRKYKGDPSAIPASLTQEMIDMSVRFAFENHGIPDSINRRFLWNLCFSRSLGLLALALTRYMANPEKPLDMSDQKGVRLDRPDLVVDAFKKHGM